MISGGSTGEADKTKSWVLGIALKKKQILYSILLHPRDENILGNLSKSTKEKELAKMFTESLLWERF